MEAQEGSAALVPMSSRSSARLFLVACTLVLATVLVSTGSADAASPRWELLANHAPTVVPRTASLPQQWTLNAEGNEGRFLLRVEVGGHTAQTKALPYDASAVQIQSALESLKLVGKNVVVTGGPTAPGEARWSYRVRFVGTFLGHNVEGLEAEVLEPTAKEAKEAEARGEEPEEAEAEAEELYEASRNTVIYQLAPENIGGAATSGPVTVTDALPPGLVTLEDAQAEGGWSCTAGGEGHTEVTCTTNQPVSPASGAPTISIAAYADPSLIKDGEQLVNTVTITGGGAAPVTTHDSAVVGETPATFGVHDFKAAALNADGEVDTTAGDHPYSASTSFFLNTLKEFEPWEQQWQFVTAGNVKDTEAILPEGFLGNPAGGRARCSQPEFLLGAKGGPKEGVLGCQAETQVGVVQMFAASPGRSPIATPVYNLNPPAGVPAEFGFTFQNTPVRLDAHVRRIHGAYRVAVLSPDINAYLNIYGLHLTLWGVPADSSHDPERTLSEDHKLKGAESKEAPHRPFLTNPADCLVQARQHPVTGLRYDQWESPGGDNSEGEPLLGSGDPGWYESTSEPLAPVTGCDQLAFKPNVTFRPRPQAEGGSSQAAAPSGYRFGLEIPQSEDVGNLATPQLRDTTVTLPPGVSLSPSAANGLTACSSAQIELDSTSPGRCPEASQVGEVHIKSALLEEELVGRVYIGEPECAPCTEQDDLQGRVFHLLIEAEAPEAGVRIKLPGSAIAGTPATQSKAGGLRIGQVRTTFDNNPQFPFTTLTLDLKGGPRAPLANPTQCPAHPSTELLGTDTALTPWSIGGTVEGVTIAGGETANAPSQFEISWDGAGAPCPERLPFAPRLAAGPEDLTAGAHSPLIADFRRPEDREQALSGITVKLPPGLAGSIAGVARCEVSRAALEGAEAQCPEDSRIGTATTAVGAGTTPFVVSGPVYLTGAGETTGHIRGPFGLDVVVPAKAGPFNLGTVIVHAVINIDKSTTAVSVTSDPLPQAIDGVPLRVKEVQVRVDRHSFMSNPTNCESGPQHEISATLTGQPQKDGEAAAVDVSGVPLTARGCGALPFKPAFAASSNAHTSKRTGASLTVKVSQQPGEAHIRRVELQLPRELPSRLETLHQACTDTQFQSDPAGCPEGSFVGTATVHTPLLSGTLTGPAILVSHANRAFPDLVYLLQGEGVHIELVGSTNIENGITYSKFETVPDAPLTSFETTLPTGPHALLTAYGSICQRPLFAPTTITSQANSQVIQKTPISVAACPPTVRITSTRALAGRLVVTVRTSQSGRVTISGAGLMTTRRTLSAGTHRITIPLTAAGRAAARGHRKITVRARVAAAGQSGSTIAKART